MTAPKPGSRVRVTVEGVVGNLEPELAGGRICVIDDDDSINWVNFGGPDAEVEILSSPEPENWPPQIGDVWAAEGFKFYCLDPLNMIAVDKPSGMFESCTWYIESFLDDWDNPVLEYRA